MKIKTAILKSIFCAGAGLVISPANAQSGNVVQKPNILYILADDLGYGDLSCYGQQRFSTPNIDRLAAEGLRFTQHYSGCPVCAPSRSSLMTGLHTGHTAIRGNKSVEPEGQQPLPDNAITLAEILKKAGYATGAFGKWGLGPVGSTGDPNKQGFDEFFGFNCQSLAHNYYPFYLWHNQDKVFLKGNEGTGKGEYAPEIIHQKALDFMRKNHPGKTGKPFFLYYPTTIPHAELFVPEKYIASFRKRFLPEKSFKGTDDGPQYKLGPYGSQPEAHAAFAGMVSCLDEKVGELIALLKELGIEKNTLVIFTSDNGPHLEGGADPDFFNSNGPLRGYKRDVYEGGIREPMIAWWPGTIQPGRTTGHVSAFWDVLPTMAEVTGVEFPKNCDGISFLPTLLNKPGQRNHDYLYWEFHEQNGKQAIRQGKWKAVRLNLAEGKGGITELYDLETDQGETTNVADKHPDLVKNFQKLLLEAHTPNEIFTLKGVDK